MKIVDLLQLNLLNSVVRYKNNYHRPNHQEIVDSTSIQQILFNQNLIMLMLLDLKGLDTDFIQKKINDISYNEERKEFVL